MNASRIVLLLKAAMPGGAHADLFGAPVQVAGHTRKGKYVAPYTATRHVAPVPPAAVPPPVVSAPVPAPTPAVGPPVAPMGLPQRPPGVSSPDALTAEQKAAVARLAGYATRYEAAVVHPDGRYTLLCYTPRRNKQGLHAALSERAKAALAFLGAPDTAGVQHAKGAHELLVDGGGRVIFTGRTQRDAIQEGKLPYIGDWEPAEAPAPAKDAKARVELDALRAGIDRDYDQLAARYRHISGAAEQHARSLEPGRGGYFGRGATTWTVRQEGWYQDALLAEAAKERASALALASSLERRGDAAARMAVRLGVNEPWKPSRNGWSDAQHLLDLVRAPPAAAEPQHVAEMRADLARLSARRYLMATEDTWKPILAARLAAKPDRWKPGMGVRWPVMSGGRAEQWNRGFRVMEVSTPDLMARVRMVRDTGLTTTGGNNDRMGDEWVYLGDLRREKASDAAGATKP